MSVERRLPVGAEFVPGSGVHFRVWAPRRRTVETAVEGAAAMRLEPGPDGYHAGFAPSAVPGSRYRFRLDGGAALYPDPASRFQPEGPHGPSEVVDPSAFPWSDQNWHGPAREGQVIYEMHIGTFTREGTYAAAAEQLPELARLGVTIIELMPVAEFAGSFGWGYDGVDLFAPTHLYGRPDDLRGFVDRAHSLGLAVILDVVYNHFGPDGNYLREFAEDHFTDRYANEWGEAINFDQPNSGPVREVFIANAGYWISEFHMDGLRLDATQSMPDSSPAHILGEIGRSARHAAGTRSVLLIAENEPQHTRTIRSLEQGGYGLDMLWNDDFHHTATVALTGRAEAYYSDYRGTPQEFISSLKRGYLYQGQFCSWQGQRRGQPSFGVPPSAFVTYIQNHDQIANSARGLRIQYLTSPGRFRAMTAILLLGPGTPMLFQGQEFASSSPFLYFADHGPELSRLIRKGRAEFLSQFPGLKAAGITKALAPAIDRSVFDRCILDLTERERHAPVYRLHRDLLRLRRDDNTLRLQGSAGLDGAVLAPDAFVLRWFGDKNDDRIMIVNLGVDAHLNPAPEPLLAPPFEKRWELLFSTEDPAYGGSGTPPLESAGGWLLPGNTAVLLRPADPTPEILEREKRILEEVTAGRKRERDEHA